MATGAPTAPTAPAADQLLQPGAEVRRRSVRPSFTPIAWSLIAGVLAAATFPPVGWWWLAPVAYAPVLWCWRTERASRAALCGFVFGVTVFGITCLWMWYFGAVAMLPFLAALAAFPAVCGYTLALLRSRGLGGPWLEAAVWVAFEGLRSIFPLGGMPWATAGSALAPFAPARALAPIGGALLVSFVVIAVNGLLLDALSAAWRPRAARRRLAHTGIAVASLVVLVALASIVRPTTKPAGSLRFALLQANTKNRYLTAEEIARNYLLESHLALADTLVGPYDLIVFPESALDGADPETDPILKRRIADLAARHQSWVMVNVNEQIDGAVYNTNRVYGPDGELIGAYRKQHLVPFGEYVPFEDLRSVIPQLEQIGNGYTAGAGMLTVPVAGHPITTLICFENAFGPLARESIADGAEALVLSTNNRSYRRSANSAQHVQLSQWRAAELGRPVLHAAISGISAVIDERGSVRERSGLFEAAVLTGSVTLRQGSTPYARVGDWVLLACLIVGIVAVASTLRPAGGRAGRIAP